MYGKEIKEIFDRLNIIEKLYDQIRIVDPINKRVISYNEEEEMEAPMKCFMFWGKDKVCDNCVSVRAYNENETFIKLEYNKNEIYMVTAIPIQLAKGRVVIELFKNATNSMILHSGGELQEDVVGGMIDNINHMAARDSLTGVFNRRYIYNKLPADLVNATISGHRIGLVMADIDHFKLVNDTYGHLAGDEVLKTFARVISGELKRESDWVARYGGEEFLICIPGASRDVTHEISERIRRAFEDTVTDSGGFKIRATASFGICHLIPDAGITIENVIECADKNLYLAKNNGRNRVEG